jgi:flagellar basal body-associated protein FliL
MAAAAQLRGVDTDLARSRKILTSMARRAMANKFIMIFIIIALFLFICLIVYIQWFSGGGSSNNSGSRSNQSSDGGASSSGKHAKDGKRLLFALRELSY